MTTTTIPILKQFVLRESHQLLYNTYNYEEYRRNMLAMLGIIVIPR